MTDKQVRTCFYIHETEWVKQGYYIETVHCLQFTLSLSLCACILYLAIYKLLCVSVPLILTVIAWTRSVKGLPSISEMHAVSWSCNFFRMAFLSSAIFSTLSWVITNFKNYANIVRLSLETTFIYLFTYWRPVNHTALFTKWNLTQVEYNTKHAHFTNVSPFGIALIKNGNKVRRSWYQTVSVWRFNTRFFFFF